MTCIRLDKSLSLEDKQLGEKFVYGWGGREWMGVEMGVVGVGFGGKDSGYSMCTGCVKLTMH